MGIMNSIYITKKCNCDKNNWIKYKTKNQGRNPQASSLIHCNKCNAQWYSRAKYVNEIPFANNKK